MDVNKSIIEKLICKESKRLPQMVAENRKIKGGTIKKRKKGSKYYYTECIDGKEYGITDNEERIHLLYRKRYLKREIQKSKILIKSLEKLLDEIEPRTTTGGEIHLGVYSYLEWCWMKENYDSNPLYPEALQYKTLMGTKVRSKSEVNIANTLERMGIPYRYEQKTYLNDMAVYPDFTIMKDDGALVLWEHYGLTENQDYMRKADIKTLRYMQAGYKQHTNLIITYEDDIKEPEEIENIIKRFIIF